MNRFRTFVCICITALVFVIIGGVSVTATDSAPPPPPTTPLSDTLVLPPVEQTDPISTTVTVEPVPATVAGLPLLATSKQFLPYMSMRSQPYYPPDNEAYEFEAIAQVNAERLKRGIHPLVHDYRLTQAARRHSFDMRTHQFVSHTGSDGSRVATRTQDAGYCPEWRGEAAGFVSSHKDIVSAFMNSPPHRDILLRTKATDIGVGLAFVSPTGYYVTLVTGQCTALGQ